MIMFWIVVVLVALYFFLRRRKRKKLAKAEVRKTAAQLIVQVDHPEGKVSPHSMPKEDYTNLRPDVMRAAERQAEAALERDRAAGKIVPLRRNIAARHGAYGSTGMATKPDTDTDGPAFGAAVAGALIVGREFGLIPVTTHVQPDGKVVDDVADQLENTESFGLAQDNHPMEPERTSTDSVSDMDDDRDNDSSDSNNND